MNAQARENANVGKAAPAPFYFVDATAESGLARFHQTNGSPEKALLLETIGGGVAFFDCDNDGDLDVFLTNGAGIEDGEILEGPTDALFVNQGDGRFVDGTQAAQLGDRHWTCGVRIVDLDGDGWQDLYLTNYGPNSFYRNLGDGRFEECAERLGLACPDWSTGAAFFDADRDGDLDLYIANYVDFDPKAVLAAGLKEEYRGIKVSFGPRGLPGAKDRFFRNQGDGHFKDVSTQVGIADVALYGFQVVVWDQDGDGWLDLYVANDSQPNLLWRNKAGERFEDVAFQCGAALSMNGSPQASMGIAFGDYDQDLLPDLYITNFAEDYNTLYRGSTNNSFRDVTTRLNLRTPTLALVGWGAGFEDFDSDGDLDLYAVHGHVYPQVDQLELGTSYAQPSILIENLGNGQMQIPELGAGPGFSQARASRGSAVGDYDEDGDLDILIGVLDGAPLLLRNDSPRQGNWVKLRLIGKGDNRDAIGARLDWQWRGKPARRWVGTAAGFLSSDDPRIHIGLAEFSKLEQLEILWPDGTLESVRDLGHGQTYQIEQGRGIVTAR